MPKAVQREVDAVAAAHLFHALRKAKPWLADPGVMSKDDADAETEALIFLLNLSRMPQDDWGATCPAARRVANSLLIDFMLRLIHPSQPFDGVTWQVPVNVPEWQQALAVMEQEILKSHPYLAQRH